jgi:spectinomycin phosphotransferase/16S rRNA (guanine(1405)-N(7))-methyltransferase
MRTRPADLPDAVLLGALAEGWDLDAVSLDYLPVGFGSHHWHATDTGDRRWFVTVDDLDAKRNATDELPETAFERLRGALATARAVSDAGAAFVVSPIPTREGAVVRQISTRFALALYPFVDGQSRSGGYQSASDRLAVLDLIVNLHSSPDALTRDTSVDDYVVAHRDELTRALDETAGQWDHGPYSERARVLLAWHAPEVTRLLARYDELVDEARGHRTARMVLTHGEPHFANVIFTSAGPVLIDWDTTMIAPPERDLWMLESGDGKVVDTYTRVTGTQVLRPMLDLYRLRWRLTEVAVYTALFRQPHADDADARESWKDLNSYLGVAPKES